MILMGGLLHDGRVRKESVSLQSHGCEVTIVTMPRAPEGGAGLEGIAVKEIVLMTRGLSLGSAGLVLKYSEFVLRAVAKALRTKARAYHAHDLPTLLPAYLAARLSNGKLVYDAHELFTEQGSPYSDSKYWRYLERWLLKRVDGILTTNESRAEIIHREYGAESRPVAIYNCPVMCETLPDATPLRKFVQLAVPELRRIVLFHGAISDDRQCEELIDSAKELDKGTVIVFLGYGSPESYIAKLESSAARQGAGKKVLFHPSVPNDRVIEYIQSADVGVVFYENSCRNNYYCASNKLFDFLAVGVPVLASDLPGINEITEGRDVGITVNSENPHEIGAAINRLVADESAYDRMQENARRLSRSQFNWARQEEVLLDFYRKLLRSAETRQRDVRH